MSPLIDAAAMFAQGAHAGQVRKYTGEPYWHHCRAVARRVFGQTGDEEMTAAAWLHDTVEDTPVTVGVIVDTFGLRVALLVAELTDVYTHEAFPNCNRKARKAAECKRLADVSDDAKLIKRADITDNTSSIIEHDPRFAKVFLAEITALLKVLT